MTSLLCVPLKKPPEVKIAAAVAAESKEVEEHIEVSLSESKTSHTLNGHVRCGMDFQYKLTSCDLLQGAVFCPLLWHPQGSCGRVW